jgi:hypothetical protein
LARPCRLDAKPDQIIFGSASVQATDDMRAMQACPQALRRTLPAPHQPEREVFPYDAPLTSRHCTHDLWRQLRGNLFHAEQNQLGQWRQQRLPKWLWCHKVPDVEDGCLLLANTPGLGFFEVRSASSCCGTASASAACTSILPQRIPPWRTSSNPQPQSCRLHAAAWRHVPLVIHRHEHELDKLKQSHGLRTARGRARGAAQQAPYTSTRT